MPFVYPLVPAAVCRSPYDRVFVIGLRGSDVDDMSFVLGVTVVVSVSIGLAAGAVAGMLVSITVLSL